MRRALVLVTGLVMLAAGCGGGGGSGGEATGGDANTPPDEPVTIRVGWVPAPGGVEQLSLMATNPELTPNQGTWYELEFNDFAGTPEVAQGLAAGTLDAGNAGSLVIANAIDQGADLVIAGMTFQERSGWGETTWLVRKDSGIRSAADLRGKTLATNSTGAYTDYVANQYLQEAGLEVNRDYNWVEVPFPQLQDALLSGQVDSGAFPVVFARRALATGQFEPLFSATDVVDPMVILVQAFRRDFVEENRAAVEKFMEDYAALSQYMAEPENRPQVLESFTQTSQQPAEVAEAYLLTEEDYYRTPGGGVDVELLQSNWDFFREAGAFQSELKVEDHVIPGLAPPA